MNTEIIIKIIFWFFITISVIAISMSIFLITMNIILYRKNKLSSGILSLYKFTDKQLKLIPSEDIETFMKNYKIISQYTFSLVEDSKNNDLKKLIKINIDNRTINFLVTDNNEISKFNTEELLMLPRQTNSRPKLLVAQNR